MNLTTRLVGDRDWEECVDLLQDGFLYSDGQRAGLPALWRRMQRQGHINAALLEDLSRPPGRRLLQFGVTAFVTDEFLREVRAAPAPGLGRRVLERVWRGCSPILDPAAVRRANSGDGLNLCVLHFGLTRQGVPEADLPLLIGKLPENFLWLHEGYRLREIVLEHYDDRLVHFATGGGFHVRAAWPEFVHPGQPAGLGCPRLLGITRAEALAEPGAYIARMFPYTPPRLFFRPGEQQILLRALRDETDDEIAAALSVSPATVKTRWRTVFARVAAGAPDLLPLADTGRRGAEKRRPLLRFLRDHPEELRPVLPPRP